MLIPIAEKTYDFWVYVCPRDITFSSKQAVKSLWEAYERGTVPWGTINMSTEPLLDQLIRFMINEQTSLPSEVGQQVLEIVITNSTAEHSVQKTKIAFPIYAASTA